MYMLLDKNSSILGHILSQYASFHECAVFTIHLHIYNVQLQNKVQWDSIGSFWVMETGFQHQEHMQHQYELLYVNFIVVEYAQES